MFFERLGKVVRENYSRFSLKKNGKVNRPRDPRFSSQMKEMEDLRHYRDAYEKDGRFPLFTQILIETRTDCNRRCSFCPQAHSQRSFKEMEWHVFQKIIQDLAKINFSGRVAFYMTNEPLLDRRMSEMIRYARRASARFFLDLNTNGNLLNLGLMDELIRSGLDNINIDDYRSDRDEFPTRLSKNIQPIRDMYAFNPKVQIDHRRTDEVLSNRAGTVSKNGSNPYAQSFCNYPFRKLTLSPHGDVVLCCYDYHYTAKIGNVMDLDLDQIWQSDALRDYRLSLLSRKRTGICAGCDAYQYGKHESGVLERILT